MKIYFVVVFSFVLLLFFGVFFVFVFVFLFFFLGSNLCYAPDFCPATQNLRMILITLKSSIPKLDAKCSAVRSI